MLNESKLTQWSASRFAQTPDEKHNHIAVKLAENNVISRISSRGKGKIHGHTISTTCHAGMGQPPAA